MIDEGNAIPLSNYGRGSTAPAPVNRMMAAFATDFRDAVDINLGVGYVNEATIPREEIEQALHEVLAHPELYHGALNYGGPFGSAHLIESIKRFHLQRNIGGLTDEDFARNAIIIGANGASSLLEGIAHIIEPGIVMTCDPMYYIYCDLLARCGFDVHAVPEDDNGIDVDRLEATLAALGSRREAIRFFYIVTVNNPTCSILSNDRRQAIVEIAMRLSRQLKRKVPVFFDKAYESLIHDPTVAKPISGLRYDKLGIVYEIDTLSKVLAPALRIGYMLGPRGPFLAAMVQKTSDAGFSAPLVTQEIASYLLDHHVAQQIGKVNAGYREKARMTRQWIAADLDGVLAECRGGRAGFYFYLTFARVATHEGSPFFRFLSRTTGNVAIDGPAEQRAPSVLYIPGEFCVHSRGELVDAARRQLRLSYGYEELPRIRKAIGLMRQAAWYAEAGQ